MIRSERLEGRMRDRNMSQSELARRVGVSQQAIWKLVNGSSRTSGRIGRIARELGTTPAWLEGETDDPDADAPAEPELTPDQRELVECFEELPESEQAALLQIAKAMAGRAVPARVHAPSQTYRTDDVGR